LKVAKVLNVKKLEVFGDSKLVVLQVRNKYQTKQLRLKQYKNELWDLTENYFLAFYISFIPRISN